MTWNHRVLRHRNERGEYFAIHEVYYDEEQQPDLWSDPIDLVNETLDDLREEVAMIQRALDTPVLEVVDGKLHEVPA